MIAREVNDTPSPMATFAGPKMALGESLELFFAAADIVF